MKVTFKKHKKEGSYRSFQLDYTDIKLGRKVNIGSITESRKDNDYSVQIMVVTSKEENSCGWGWVKFKARFKTEQEARDWFIANYEKISQKYNIYQSE